MSAARFLALALGAGLPAQEWRTVQLPLARDGPGLAYDMVRARALLFGGETAVGMRDETLLFDGSDWIRVEPPHRPPARRWGALATDLVRARVVLFGGILVGNAIANDTWEWDGADWTQIATLHAPSPRAAAMAFDIVRGRVTLFGDDLAPQNETWVYDGTD